MTVQGRPVTVPTRLVTGWVLPPHSPPPTLEMRGNILKTGGGRWPGQAGRAAGGDRAGLVAPLSMFTTHTLVCVCVCVCSHARACVHYHGAADGAAHTEQMGWGLSPAVT